MANEKKVEGPHQGQPVYTAGVALETAKAAMVMIHGRGGTAESILALIDAIGTPGFAYLAPQASGNTWYPNSFLAPIPANEPGISSGLQLIDEIVASLESAGIEANRIMLLGFSQGACLTLEYAARHARRYGGVCGLSGGVIGPDETPRDYAGTFAGTPVFLGCSDVDAHIPKKRVEETAAILKRMKAEVTMRIYPGMGHLVNEDEIAEVKRMMTAVSGSDR
ncbi:MAG TPA: dienelactone hydrolase family protein [Gemmatimonadaceae bacterium]|nr:dienelactone hydrolase family protein [Gemmatimonadaceae bacterium]